MLSDVEESLKASQVMLVVRNLPANAGDLRDMGLIPVSGRSPGEGNGNPLQYPCLEISLDRGAWQAMGLQRVRCAVAAELLHSCPTLCDPMDSSPPGSSFPGILQARILEWVAISSSQSDMTE